MSEVFKRPYIWKELEDILGIKEFRKYKVKDAMMLTAHQLRRFWLIPPKNPVKLD